MIRIAVAGLICLSLGGWLKSESAAAKPHTAPEAAAPKPGDVPPWAQGDPDLVEAVRLKDPDIKAFIIKEGKAHGSYEALKSDPAFMDKLRTKLNQAKLAKATGAKATKPAPVKPASAKGIVADQPQPADSGDPLWSAVDAPAAAPAPAHTRAPKTQSVSPEGKGSLTEGRAGCLDCPPTDQPSEPAPVLSPQNEENVRSIADMVTPVGDHADTEHVYRPSSVGDDGGGCGFLGCITSRDLLVGGVSALVGGVAGYFLGKHSGQNNDDPYGQYYGYRGWQRTGFPGSFGPLPGAYRLGQYGYGAPPYLPFPGPSTLGGLPLGGQGYGQGYQGYPIGGVGQGGYPYTGVANGGYYGGAVNGGYYGVNGAYNYGAVNTLCPNCTLPVMYPLTSNGGVIPTPLPIR